ncbi:HTH-type transcriptional regulator UlaR, partial [Salmonella enterica subsp. enterica serovar Poona]
PADRPHNTERLPAKAEQKMLSVVGKLVALVDSSKIGERAGMLFSRADQIAMLITGKNANPQVLQQLEAQGVSILRV